MPTIRESANIDRSRLQPAAPAPAMPMGANTLVPPATAQMSPFLHAAMPVSASTYDSLTRQFYGNQRVPLIRILPTGGKK